MQYENFKNLVKANRSYRRFDEKEPISYETMLDLVDTARLTPSAANRQPIRYKIVSDPDACAGVFETLGWAGYLKDWDGPVEGERPTGYIVLVGKTDLNSAHDEGIIAQTILLNAVRQGFGGCMLLNVKKEELAKKLNVPEGYGIKLVIALGKPVEEVVLDEISAEGDIKYYREPNMVHHVPKIRLEDLLV